MNNPDTDNPLSERLSPDVFHENIVPKYGALTSAPPTRLVLCGIWLIFAPMALGMVGIAASMIADSPDALTAIVASVLPACFLMLSLAVLFIQTRRHLNANREFES